MRLSLDFDLQLGAFWKQECLKRGQPIPMISTPPPVIIAESEENQSKSA
jgi:hypothetical protein